MTDFLDAADYEVEPRKRNSNWQARGALYRSALRDGMTIEELAEEEGKSVGGVRIALRRAGYNPYEFLTKTEKWIAFLCGPTCHGTDEDVAEILGVSTMIVTHTRRRALAQ